MSTGGRGFVTIMEYQNSGRGRGWTGAGIPVVMEASFGWGWLSDLMKEAGFEVRLSNCFKVEKMRKARGWVKTNDKDAALQAKLLLEKDAWWEVWRAPREVRERREWMRHRADLVIIQTQTKNRIHAIFHRHGVFHDFSDLFGGLGRRFLVVLMNGQDRQSVHLPTGAKEALRGDLELQDHLRRALAKITCASCAISGFRHAMARGLPMPPPKRPVPRWPRG